MKDFAESTKFIGGRERRDSMALAKRAAEDAVEDANSFAVLVRRQFEKSMPQGKGKLSVLLQSGVNEKAGAGFDDEEIDGVLIHPIEGSTQLVLSDELQQICLETEVEAIQSEPLRLFHVQSRSPWVQCVVPGAA